MSKVTYKNRDVYASEDGFVVYCPPPGQSSGPRKVELVRAGSFIATPAAWQDVLGPYSTRDEAVKAAERDAVRAGYPSAAIMGRYA